MKRLNFRFFFQALANRIIDQLADIERRKEKLDAEMIELEQNFAEVVNYFAGSRVCIFIIFKNIFASWYLFVYLPI